MLYATCPVCASSVYLAMIPERLPVLVPEHRSQGGIDTCSGGGRKSASVWMTRPEPVSQS